MPWGDAHGASATEVLGSIRAGVAQAVALLPTFDLSEGDEVAQDFGVELVFGELGVPTFDLSEGDEEDDEEAQDAGVVLVFGELEVLWEEFVRNGEATVEVSEKGRNWWFCKGLPPEGAARGGVT